jgi:acyl-CoA thioester hydrolase
MNNRNGFMGQIEIDVRTSEIDPYNIAHHSNYLIWYELGREKYMREFMQNRVQQINLYGTTKKLEYFKTRYSNPVHMGDQLTVYTFLEKQMEIKDKVIFWFKQKIRNKNTGKVVNICSSRVSFIIR